MRNLRQSLLLALAASLVGGSANADWLVTRDGGKIETKGAWKVEGKRVLFTQPNGTLSSIRADQIDLDLSAVETQKARTPAPAPVAEAKPEPVLRLTERDFPPVRDLDEGAEGTVEKKEEATSTGLEVISWEKTETPNGDGIEIFGTVRNNGNTNVTSPALVVTLYDEEGRLIATADGRVNAPAITAGKTANFRVVFPGVADFAAARFDAQGTPFALRRAAAGEEGEGGELSPEESVEPDDLAPEEGEELEMEPAAAPPL